MRFNRVENYYIIRLDKGEPIINTLTKFCKENKITAATFTGIGAVSRAELAHYHLKTQEYSEKKFDEPLEIISLTGNVTKEKIHAHISLGTTQMETIGGHLKEATVSATCEIFLRNFNITLEREFNQTTGLQLLKI